MDDEGVSEDLYFEAGEGLDVTEEHSSYFDELAVGLAGGTLSRGRAMKLVGAAIVGGAFGFLGLPVPEAEARRRKKKRHRRPPPPTTFTFTGSIGPGDTNQSGRLIAGSGISTCTFPRPYPGTFDNQVTHSDVYTFRSGPGSACVTVTYTPSCEALHSAAYIPFFNPANIAENYAANSGSGPPINTPVSYSFIVPANTTFDVVLNEARVGENCASYDLSVSGVGITLLSTS